jgi:hypothetical protein
MASFFPVHGREIYVGIHSSTPPHNIISNVQGKIFERDYFKQKKRCKNYIMLKVLSSEMD